jgi:hypothetical protein
MKTKLFTLLLLSSLFVENAYTQDKTSIGAIQKVIVSSGILLQIERTPDYSLSTNMQDVDESCLIKTINAGVLTLKLTSSFSCKGKVTINLGCPSLREIEIMGNADVSSRNVLTGDSMKIILRSGGKAYLDLDIKNLDVHMTEGSLLSASGYAVNQNVYVSSSSTYSCFELEGDYVTVEATLGGKAKVCSSKELKASTMTGGYIGYKCDPASKTIESKGNGVVQLVSED